MQTRAGLLFLIASLCGCGGGSGRTNDPAGGGSGTGGSGGSSGSGGTGNTGGGVRDPDVIIDEETDTGLAVKDSILTINAGPAGDQLAWLFTVQNTSAAPVCSSSIPARILDANGTVLAASGGGASLFIDATTPGFYATARGMPYRNRATEGQLRDCIPPGEHGIGSGVVTFQVEPSGPEEMQRIIDSAARIEFTVAGSMGPQLEGIELATDLLWLDDLELADAADGKIGRGTVNAGAELSRWRVDGAFFDDAGKITSIVSAYSMGSLAGGASASFELASTSPTATRFEAFAEGTLALSR